MRARIISMVVLAASLLVAGQVLAQSDGSATFGGQWWSQTNPEAKFREYRDLPRGGYLEDYVLRNFDGPWAAAVWGNDALTNSQGNSAYLAKGVTWRLDAQYTGSPHNFSFIARSPYAQVSPGVFRLPDVLQQQNVAASGTNYNNGMANVYASSPFSSLGIQTDVSRARLRLRPVKDWQFDVRGTDRERQGSMAYGMPFGTSNTIELPVPVNQRTIDVDATASYAHGPARVLATVGVSNFTNRVPTVIWDNPKVLRDSAYWSAPTSTRGSSYTGIGSTGRMAMAPDNRVIRGNAAFSVKLPYSSTLTATLGLSQTTQEQAFIPLTMNPKLIAGAAGDSAAGIMGNSAAALPARDLAGKVVSVVKDVRWSARPMPKLSGTVRWREDKFDDQTPELAFLHGVSPTDQSISRLASASAAEVSEPWSHKSSVYGVDADYSLLTQLDVSLLAEHRGREHPLREVEKDAENVYGASMRLRPSGSSSLTAGYKYGTRKIDTFDIQALLDSGDRTYLRRFDVADRNQSAFNATAMWAPSDMLDLSVSGWWNKDDYKNTTLGLNSVENTQYFADAGLHPNPVVDLTGGFGYGEMRVHMSGIEGGSASNPATLADPWTSAVNDKNVYAFANASWWATPKKLQLVARYTFTRDMQLNALEDTLTAKSWATNIDLPGAFYRTHDVSVEAHWYYAAGLDFGCRYGYTRYDVSDGVLQTIPYVEFNPSAPTTAAVALNLGNNKMSYKANRIQVFATRRF